jgi:hypothetical protein
MMRTRGLGCLAVVFLLPCPGWADTAEEAYQRGLVTLDP